MLSCDVIIWDDSTPPFLLFLETSLTRTNSGGPLYFFTLRGSPAGAQSLSWLEISRKIETDVLLRILIITHKNE